MFRIESIFLHVVEPVNSRVRKGRVIWPKNIPYISDLPNVRSSGKEFHVMVNVA